MTKTEILAPVGNEAMLKAAVFSGADAVYLGLSDFNARRSAGNFTPEQLAQAVAFCHARGVRVHLAINTTVYGSELAPLASSIRQGAEAGVDALILQDLAAAALARQIAPGIQRHGSTQMSVHTLEGVLQLAEMGFSRAILARELSMAEIRAIAQASPIEVEVFVHGALCMSMSGQCYMSAFLGGRSGNRGSCAGPCRLPFDAGRVPEGKPGAAHHLSLKDLDVIHSLPELTQAGVASVKIEGRLRTPEYVAAAVAACRGARDGEAYDGQLARDLFSRSGFTEAYLNGKISAEMFGTRTEADAALTREALPKARELFRREFPRVPVDLVLTAEADGCKLSACDDAGNRVVAYGSEELQPARTDPAEGIRRSLGKTGGTPFFARSIRVEQQEGQWFVPGSVANELRRSCLEQLLAKRAVPRACPSAPAALPALASREFPRHSYAARFEHWAQVPGFAPGKLRWLILPLAEAGEVPEKWRSKTLLELPRAMFGALEKDTARRVEATREQGFGGYLAQNLAHLRLCRGLPLYGGFGLNVTNPLAAREYAALGLRGITVLPEVTCAEMASIDPGVPTAALIYGYMPLMLTRACPLQNVTDCKRCSKKGTLTDRKAVRFAVRCSQGVRTIYNSVPLYMGDKLGQLPADLLVAWFTVEGKEQAAHVLELLAEGKPFDGDFTRGLYFKGTN